MKRKKIRCAKGNKIGCHFFKVIEDYPNTLSKNLPHLTFYYIAHRIELEYSLLPILTKSFLIKKCPKITESLILIIFCIYDSKECTGT